jgi:hypothetical protein
VTEPTTADWPPWGLGRDRGLLDHAPEGDERRGARGRGPGREGQIFAAQGAFWSVIGFSSVSIAAGVSSRAAAFGRLNWAESAPTEVASGRDPARFAEPPVKAQMLKRLWLFGDRREILPVGGGGLALRPRGLLRTAGVDSETSPLRRPPNNPISTHQKRRGGTPPAGVATPALALR